MISIKDQVAALDRLTKFYENTGDRRVDETREQADTLRKQLPAEAETVQEVIPAVALAKSTRKRK